MSSSRPGRGPSRGAGRSRRWAGGTKAATWSRVASDGARAMVPDGCGTLPPRRPDAARGAARARCGARRWRRSRSPRRDGGPARRRRSGALLERRLLLGRRRAGMARARPPDRPADRPERLAPPRRSAILRTPSAAAIAPATVLELQTPPPSGGVFSRSREPCRAPPASGPSPSPAAPPAVPPSEDGPKTLRRAGRSSIRRGATLVGRAASATVRPCARSPITWWRRARVASPPPRQPACSSAAPGCSTPCAMTTLSPPADAPPKRQAPKPEPPPCEPFSRNPHETPRLFSITCSAAIRMRAARRSG